MAEEERGGGGVEERTPAEREGGVMDEEELRRVRELIKEGYKPVRKVKGGKVYIALRKGDSWIGMGPYTDEKWNLLQEIVREVLGEGGEARVAASSISEARVQSAIAGSVRGAGYLQELKDMIRYQISRTRELTEFAYDLGLAVLAAALSKSGTDPEALMRMIEKGDNLRGVLYRAAQVALAAINEYGSKAHEVAEAIRQLELERDEARVAYTILYEEYKKLLKALEALKPAAALERMITAYLASGNIDPAVLNQLMSRWLQLQLAGGVS